MQGELITRQCRAQVIFNAQSLTGRRLHVAVKQLRGVAPAIFGPVQRNVCSFEKVGGRAAMIGDQCDTNAGGDLQALAVKKHRLG